MALTKSQMTMFEKARRRGAGDQGISLTDGAVRGLISIVSRDLCVKDPTNSGAFDDREYYEIPVDSVDLGNGLPILDLLEQLLQIGPDDTDTYFFSLAALHRARLKFANIMALQATSSLEQVGARGLLQFGDLDAKSLGSLLILRKWLFDIDNRAAQETGYLFEPMIAGAIGGVPVSAGNSPVKRDGVGVGRQVDCLRGKRAYEVKIRVTIAASGQGRWGEELAFPADYQKSGYVPVLVVLDGTRNKKLEELQRVFLENGGEVFVGDKAWSHLQTEAGKTMGLFIEKYIQAPLRQLLSDAPAELLELRLKLAADSVQIAVGETSRAVKRVEGTASPKDDLPSDVAAVLPDIDPWGTEHLTGTLSSCIAKP